MVILAGLPRLRVVFGCGFGEYTMEGLPPSVRHLNLQVRWLGWRGWSVCTWLVFGRVVGWDTSAAHTGSTRQPTAHPDISPPTHPHPSPPIPHATTHANHPQWSMTPGASFAAIDFQVPEGCSLDSLTLCSQRPLCLGAPCLARCATLRLTARRCYLGLPLRRGAPWADVDDLAARFAQVGPAVLWLRVWGRWAAAGMSGQPG